MRESASNPLRRCALLGALAGFATLFTTGTAPAQECVEVDRVVLEGAVSLDAAALEAELSGRAGCLDRADLNELLEIVTLAYADAGYVAARGYLPPQDLSDGELTIAVVEGTVSGIDLRENGEAAPSRAATAFPGMIGRPLRLRRLEQGIAQIDRLPSSRATSELRPGAESGETVLAVEVQQGSRFRGGASLDDRGSDSTGRYNFGLNGSFDDLLGLNDAWTIGLQLSSEPSPRDTDIGRPLGRSLSLTGSMPWGMWTFGLSGSVSDYSTDIAGVLDPVPSEGSSANLRLSADRVLSSTKSGRWDAGVSLAVKENENLILGARIDTASRRLSVLDAHLSAGRPLLGGQAQARLTLRRGLGAFGAVDDDEAPEGSPKAQYRATLLDLSWARRWDLGGSAMALSLSMRGQHSDDALFGSEQFSAGGFGGVRGTRSSAIFGNRGSQLVSTLSWPAAFGKRGGGASLTPYFGLDAARVEPQPDLGIPEGRLASGTIGTRIAFGDLGVDLSWSKAFDVASAQGVPEQGIYSVQARVSF